MLVTIAGDLGSGKTFVATVIACILARHGRLIVPNYILRLENVQPFDLNTFLAGRYFHCCVILDEAYVYLESRISTSNLNRAMSHIVFQSRKRDCDVIVTVQLNDTIDLRFRELSQVYVLAQHRTNRFVYDIYRRMPDRTTKHFMKSIPLRKAEALFNLYDTTQVIQTDNVIPLAHVFSREEVQDVAERFCAESEKRTKTAITGFLRLNGFPLTLADSIYYLVGGK